MISYESSYTVINDNKRRLALFISHPACTVAGGHFSVGEVEPTFADSAVTLASFAQL